MRYCHACHAQLPDDARRCLHCGGRPSDAPPDAPPSPDAGAGAPAADTEPAEPDAREDAEHLLARREPRNAPPLLEALRAAGVAFRVVGEGGTDHVQAVHGSGGRYAAIEVYVASEDRPAAEAVVRDELGTLAGALSGSGTESDRCPACGYALTGDASACPDCGLVFTA